MRVLIVDDEYLARNRIRELAVSAGAEIVGEAATGPEAVAAIESLQPDLVLLDIALPAMDGFEVLACVQSEPLPLVVFTTAYDQHAVRAFDVQALDYLLKPVEQARLEEALRRAETQLSGRQRTLFDEKMRQVLENAGGSSARVAVRSGDRVVFVKPADIDAVEAVGNYVRILRGTERFLVRQRLSVMEQRLQAHGLVRIQRSVLVNVERVAELRRQSKDQYLVVLTSGVKYRLSPNYRAHLEKVLGAF
ncbi:MAG TPA: LytTR family DNA-binding domain-containing protein [Thermoanaerobaculia bacterium]|nr:LytTR family DNA-binding domain-containing protein [Thermoanaerobaculia bacterium]